MVFASVPHVFEVAIRITLVPSFNTKLELNVLPENENGF